MEQVTADIESAVSDVPANGHASITLDQSNNAAEIYSLATADVVSAFSETIPADGHVDVTLDQTNNAAAIYSECAGQVQSTFSQGFTASADVAVTLNWHITNPSASISTSSSGSSVSATIAGHASGGEVGLNGAELSWVGEEGLEYIIPTVPARRQRGIELWKSAGRTLGVFGPDDEISAHASGGIVGKEVSNTIPYFDTDSSSQDSEKTEKETVSWEEGEDQLAARISFSAKNDKTSKGRISSLAKPGCYAALLYSYNGGKNAEATRGKIVEWNPSARTSGEKFKVKAYDVLYDLQESQDHVYFSAGVKTKSAIVQVLKRWGIKVTSYSGPNVKHGKLAYKSEKLGTVVVKILKEAKKKGGIEACLRAVKMNVTVVGFGTNKTVYHFEETQHLTEVNHKISTTGLVLDGVGLDDVISTFKTEMMAVYSAAKETNILRYNSARTVLSTITGVSDFIDFTMDGKRENIHLSSSEYADTGNVTFTLEGAET